ncbi:iron-sulfur cluster assembly accessory protein [Paenibacillus sp. 1011MAR3C5]|uniref:HesB/IscA family protein n=1 Tax=Paenibacillus sp. 1011MAR3C5 TaxID=1675787 RepID=UPI000E6C5C83|nr:iron-sulfur cluster assembly accessory protein [Paenibacillus sp. 1011MAR3C5]RJE86957.1 iron-sulfur cluster assembly accessory protein [Paenibacillus sp. 1011MAR3C5]
MIEISENATEQILEMLNSLNLEQMYLRVGVVDGGCSGLSYDLRFDDQRTEEDIFLSMNGFQMLVESRSMPFLEGLKIDYQRQGMTGGFTMDNPNVKASCGCGASFRTATYRGTAKKC